MCERCQRILEMALRQQRARPRTFKSQFLRHVFREHNKDADAGATAAIRGSPRNYFFRGAEGMATVINERCRYFCMNFDGGFKYGIAAWSVSGPTANRSGDAVQRDQVLSHPRPGNPQQPLLRFMLVSKL